MADSESTAPEVTELARVCTARYPSCFRYCAGATLTEWSPRIDVGAIIDSGYPARSGPIRMTDLAAQ
ncbi:putative transcriptional regulatory protein [Mycobacterium ulcerans str. Harvey]|uniref:Transcriptional regulatory protein n=1 Tax=Mycobacterium ulcerans str. Harvey TaxID=1299332 RepID=A0ABN0RAD0_MYCUL|nr:putative transcriptional regulatory protein [Mycobacterium ulcerans str. Harvey]